MRTIHSVLAAILVVAGSAIADVPQLVNYEGRLTTSAGLPVPDGSYAVMFSIHNSPTATPNLWSEIHTVATNDGLFAVILGSVTPIPDTALADTAAYLEIKVESDPPMTPRTRLTSVPYSRASSALRGQGPVDLRVEDVSSGDSGMVQLSAGTAGGAASPSLGLTLEGSASGFFSKEVMLTADSGIVETESAQSGSATASGKRQHRPFAISKELGASTTSGSTQWSSVLGADSGLTETTTAQNGSATATGKRQHKPIRISKEWGASTAAGSVTWNSILDVDSGITEADTVQTTSGMATGKRQHRPITISKEWGAMSAMSAAQWNSNLHADTGIVETASMTKTDLTTEVSKGTNQTREHVLLSRQVGVPGAVSESNLELQTYTDGTSLSLSKNTATDSSGIEMAIDNVAPQITLTKVVGGTKWKNITLKRGLTDGGEISVSHVGAGINDGVFMASDAATGGKIGINTSTPSLAFVLVGSGCYTGTFGACSDERFKTRVATLHDPLGTVRALRGVTYEWKRAEFPERHFPAEEQIGLIAQEVEKILPGIVQTDADGYKSVDYARITPLLIEAIKDQQNQIDELKAMVQQLATQQKSAERAKYGSR